jgi:hypothetical protein
MFLSATVLLAQATDLVQRTEGDRVQLTVLEWLLGGVLGLLLFVAGYKLGRWLEALASRRTLAQREQELFTAQKGFKALYEQELETARAESRGLGDQITRLREKVEEYRRKAAGLGGLFSSGGKRADAMYALLLENEALEEALVAQNDQLRQERTDALREQLRATGYRRVLMSQILNDSRIKEYVAEILADDRRLPALPSAESPSAPPATAPGARSDEPG